jgi:hypothetical protein
MRRLAENLWNPTRPVRAVRVATGKPVKAVNFGRTLMEQTPELDELLGYTGGVAHKYMGHADSTLRQANTERSKVLAARIAALLGVGGAATAGGVGIAKALKPEPEPWYRELYQKAFKRACIERGVDPDSLMKRISNA